jgi:hypothetical protein
VKADSAKSKIFLSAIRDVAASGLVGKQPFETMTGKYVALHMLLKSDIRRGAKKIQLESEDGNWLPLHWAGVVDGLSVDDVRAVLEYSRFTCKGSQASAIHYAAITRPPNLPVINEMSTPLSFLHKDREKQTPLHWVSKFSKDINILKYFAEKAPNSVVQRNRDGNTPLQCLVSRRFFQPQLSMVSLLAEFEATNPVAEAGGVATALHTICQREIVQDEDLPIFHALLRFLPDSVKSRDSHGALPLHCAVVNSLHWNFGFVDVLLNHYKEGTTIADNEGMLPMHCMFNGDAVSEEHFHILIDVHPASAFAVTATKKSILHCAAEQGYYENDVIVKTIHKIFPTAAQSKDRNENLPLHLACSRTEHVFETVKSIYECYPAAISEINDLGRTPLCCFLQHIDIFDLEPNSTEEDILRFLLDRSPIDFVRKYLLQLIASGERERGDEGECEDFVRRLFLRADPTILPDELRELNYAERRMAMFVVFAALSKEPGKTSFVRRLRSLAFDYGPDMYLIKTIVSFL